MPLRNILAKYWGYTTFRPLQEEIINSVMANRDTLALMPTGGGKSICFQVPALAKEGLCLVVTPLIALMKDQVENLNRKGIHAVAVYSGMSYNQIEVAFDNCMFGDVKFLYISPERLETEKFRAVLSRLNIALIAVDEAHCISQWGYDFRPPYLRIADIRGLLPGVPVLALTATATPRVVDDIQYRLSFAEKNVFQQSFGRSNLAYLVEKEENKLGRLLRICHSTPGAGIVYVRNRRRTREVAEYLARSGITADFYHAGVETALRDKRQLAWMQGITRVIVATNAFGMGIDKPNVRFVVHIDLPDSLEAYFQEAGRAGRDLIDSSSYVLYDESDVLALRQNLETSFPPLITVYNVYEALGNYFQLATGSGKDMSFSFDLATFSQTYRFKPVIVFNALKILEKQGYVMLSEEVGSPSLIHIPVKKDALYRFQVENLKYDPFIKLLLRSYTGLFSTYAPISESDLARRTNSTPEQITGMLKALVQSGVLRYIPPRNSPQIVFVTERLEKIHMRISPENYHHRLVEATERVESLIKYVTDDSHCRSRLLLSYFGEKDSSRCGRCDVCLKLNSTEMSNADFQRIKNKIIELLNQHPAPLDEIIPALNDVNEKRILKVFQWLMDNQIIVPAGDFKFMIRP